MPRVAKKHLPFDEWPPEDRVVWARTFESDVFDEDNKTAHLATPTIVGHRTAYARYLGFLTQYDPERLACAPHDRIDVDSMRAFDAHLREACRATSVASLLHTLRLTLGFLFPAQDWSWLKTAAKHIAAGAVPRGDAARGVTSAQLYTVGVALMTTAEEELASSGDVTLQTALLYRDGLIIALTALVAPRRRTLTAFTTERHLVKTGECWLLDIPVADTKTRRALEYPLPDAFSQHISRYLSRFRDVVLGAKDHDGLWPSLRGRPMAGGSINDMVRRRTKDALGFPVNLHRFRLAAGNFWSIADPANVRGVKDLLGHSSFDTTQKHYIGAQSRLAGRVLAKLL